jgi:multiple sugar transport system substrate-binding protein
LKRPLVALLLLSLFAFSACREAQAPDDPSEDVVIEFQVSGEVEEVAVYHTLKAAYEKANENVTIKLIEVADKGDHIQKLVTAFSQGEAPNVFLVNFREYSQFVGPGSIEAVGPHLGDIGIDIDDYYEPPVEAFTYDGELQCMPQNVSSLVAYYNKKLFREAGLARPQADWTWDDFRDYGNALTEGDVRGLGIEPSVIRLAPFVWSNGGEIVDSDTAPTHFTMADDPNAVDALQFLVDLVRVDGAIPTEEEIAAQDLETRFVTGKLGMLLSSRKDTPVFREVRGLKFDVLPLPVAEQPAGILHSDAYCISRDTEDLEETLKFVAYATGEEGQTLTALGGRTVPSLKSVATGGSFLNTLDQPKHPQVFLDAIPSLRRTPVLPTWPEIEDISEEILTRAFYEDGYTVEQSLQELDEATRDLFEEGSG